MTELSRQEVDTLMHIDRGAALVSYDKTILERLRSLGLIEQKLGGLGTTQKGKQHLASHRMKSSYRS